MQSVQRRAGRRPAAGCLFYSCCLPGCSSGTALGRYSTGFGRCNPLLQRKVVHQTWLALPGWRLAMPVFALDALVRFSHMETSVASGNGDHSNVLSSRSRWQRLTRHTPAGH